MDRTARLKSLSPSHGTGSDIFVRKNMFLLSCLVFCPVQSEHAMMTGLAWFFAVTCVTSISLFENAGALHCFTCSNLTNDDDCRHVNQCAANEICYVERHNHGNSTKFTSGCRNSQRCPNQRPFSIVGRSIQDNCLECCSHDGCNKDLCGIKDIQATKTPRHCEDDPLTNCSRMSTLVHICSNNEEAKQLCPKYCGLCNQVDGGWSVWGNWTSCSTTCGIGAKTRKRTCSNPIPKHGGALCPGNSTQTHSCFDRACPVHGEWNNWDAWAGCSVPCGTGVKKRHRACNNPTPSLYGRYCLGDAVDFDICTGHSCGNTTTTIAPTTTQILHCFDSLNDCSLLNQTTGICSSPQNARKLCAEFCGLCSIADGYWAGWSSWGACSTTCGNGRRSKSRTCTNPAPSKGGKSCPGSSIYSGICNVRQCSVHGNWSPWGKWTTCSASCGQGFTHRRRTCTNPRPSFNGNYCFHDPTEYAMCLVKQCPVDGGWSDWLLWSSCSVTCGAGRMTRKRLCVNPRPENNGNSCTGNGLEHTTCQPGPCIVDGNWNGWSLWSSCSVTCGTGQMTRQRFCFNPRPESGSRNCTGNSLEYKTCQPGLCTVVFNAHSVTTVSPPTGQPVVFSSVRSNIGSGYSSSRGKFTAPVNGTYIFTVQLCLHNGKYAYFSIVIDGNVVTALQDYDHDGWSTSSATIPLFLKQDQKVWVQSAGCSTCLYIHSSCWNRFSGSLI